MKTKNISILLAMVMVLSMVFTACGGEEPADVDAEEQVEDGDEQANINSLEDILENGQIVLGTSADYPPYQFHALVDGQDEIVGFEIEMAKHIAKELGVELEMKEMDFSNLLSATSSGMVDIVLAAMNPTPERLEEYDFSDIYYEATFSALIRKEDADLITKEDDLKDKSIGVQLGTTQEEIAGEFSDNLSSLTKNPDLVMQLMTEKIDCVLMETPVAQSFAAVNDELMVVDSFQIDDGSGGVATVVAKDNDELTERINEIIADMLDQGLVEKWFIEAQELSDSAIEE